MSDNIKLNIVATIENIIVAICLTILAILFNKWWIILFFTIMHVEVVTKKPDYKNKEDK